MQTSYYTSPVGILKISGSETGICSLRYCNDPVEAPAETGDPSASPILKACLDQLEAYFSGKLKQFNIPVDFDAIPSTEFQRRIWKLLLTIPFGTTISYSELARQHGDVKSVRAVGHANGQNQVNIIIPCHRVVGVGGQLTGYGGGLWRKEWLLRFEKEHAPEGLFRDPA